MSLNKKQTLLDANVAGAWNGHASIADHELRYDVALKYNHAGYNRTYLQDLMVEPKKIISKPR